MTTPTPQIYPANAESLDLAAKTLQKGQLVAFPTETVYGLGADATNDEAIARIYEAKGRPQFNPIIVHVAQAEILKDYVEWTDQAEKLADHFWPGPLTLVLPRLQNSPISLLASAGLDTIAVRCPAHPVARDLISQANCPVAAPSANASGTLSPTAARHVADSLGSAAPLIIDGGPSEVGLESTVLSLSHKVPTILRHGAVTIEMLTPLLGTVHQSLHDDTAPKSPGMLLSHYAPNIPVRLNALTGTDKEAFLTFGDDNDVQGGAMRINLSANGDLIEAAANLFSMMRECDQPSLEGIAVMPIPDEGLGLAINDRLSRAAIAKK